MSCDLANTEICCLALFGWYMRGDLDFFVEVSQLEICKCYAFCKRDLIRKRDYRTKSYRGKEAIYTLVRAKPLARHDMNPHRTPRQYGRSFCSPLPPTFSALTDPRLSCCFGLLLVVCVAASRGRDVLFALHFFHSLGTD